MERGLSSPMPLGFATHHPSGMMRVSAPFLTHTHTLTLTLNPNLNLNLPSRVGAFCAEPRPTQYEKNILAVVGAAGERVPGGVRGVDHHS